MPSTRDSGCKGTHIFLIMSKEEEEKLELKELKELRSYGVKELSQMLCCRELTT